MPYIIDTDAIVHIADRPDAESVYAKMIQMVSSGEIRTVEQVFDELRRWPDIKENFLPFKKVMLVNQYIPEILSHVGYISENFDFIFDLIGPKNPDPADPWLI